ncbi:fimbrial protein, partial [Escherichia coli]|nr:fimbrial protein [Escherichia coli]EGD4877175.1 fimbrial protein [Shigella boydii]EGD7829685.1 fimbrial protein [Escherichia coli]MJD54687.1 fimbrial protein [Escherichia coli]
LYPVCHQAISRLDDHSENGYCRH